METFSGEACLQTSSRRLSLPKVKSPRETLYLHYVKTAAGLDLLSQSKKEDTLTDTQNIEVT